jgi:hypothetical protein
MAGASCDAFAVVLCGVNWSGVEWDWLCGVNVNVNVNGMGWGMHTYSLKSNSQHDSPTLFNYFGEILLLHIAV